MPYVTGAAGSMADLLTALQDACTANGWTLSGSVLHAGNCYTQVRVIDAGDMGVLGGTGIDVNNALTVPGPKEVLLREPITSAVITFPLTYFIHVYDHEVYCVVNWALSNYTYLAFGCSPLTGLPGTGGWYGASIADGPRASFGFADATEYHAGGGSFVGQTQDTGLFWGSRGDNINGAVQSYFHHGLDGGAWSATFGTVGARADATAKCCGTAGPILDAQPNAWNGESALVPVQPYLTRPSGFASILGDLEHARYLNIANLAPETVITLGADKWRVYPFFKKGAALAPGNTDTGYLGWAVHYDGP